MTAKYAKNAKEQPRIRRRVAGLFLRRGDVRSEGYLNGVDRKVRKERKGTAKEAGRERRTVSLGVSGDLLQGTRRRGVRSEGVSERLLTAKDAKDAKEQLRARGGQGGLCR